MFRTLLIVAVRRNVRFTMRLNYEKRIQGIQAEQLGH